MSETDKLMDAADNHSLISHVVGEPRDAANPNAGDHATHDHGRKGVLDSAADAVRPAGNETTGETISRKTEE